MLTIATWFLIAQVKPPANFTVKRDAVTIERVVWFDAEGQRHVTDEPYLQVRFVVTNASDHAIAWPGFDTARVKYSLRTAKSLVGGAVLPVKFGPKPGVRWENSLVTGQVVKPGQTTQVLVVFDRPGSGGQASLVVKWRGESPGWVMTVSSGFKLPNVNPPSPTPRAKDSSPSVR
jgi:hypothetical protein